MNKFKKYNTLENLFMERSIFLTANLWKLVYFDGRSKIAYHYPLSYAPNQPTRRENVEPK